jgi:hypothetical protein
MLDIHLGAARIQLLFKRWRDLMRDIGRTNVRRSRRRGIKPITVWRDSAVTIQKWARGMLVRLAVEMAFKDDPTDHRLLEARQTGIVPHAVVRIARASRFGRVGAVLAVDGADVTVVHPSGATEVHDMASVVRVPDEALLHSCKERIASEMFSIRLADFTPLPSIMTRGLPSQQHLVMVRTRSRRSVLVRSRAAEVAKGDTPVVDLTKISERQAAALEHAIAPLQSYWRYVAKHRAVRRLQEFFRAVLTGSVERQALFLLGSSFSRARFDEPILAREDAERPQD